MDAFNKEDWPIRKIAYIAIAAALFIGLTTGIVTQEQVNTWVETFGIVTGYLGVLGLGVAATKTHRGSDERATNGDIFDALTQNGIDTGNIEDLQAKIDALVDSLAPAEPVDVVDEDQPGIYPGA